MVLEFFDGLLNNYQMNLVLVERSSGEPSVDNYQMDLVHGP